MDCQLNGACLSGICKCDLGWQGSDCGTLFIGPPMVAYGHGAPTSINTSSWGGGPPVWDPEINQYRLFVSEFAGHCGFASWGRQSQSVLANSPNLEGPYKRVKTIIPTQSHNTVYAYSSTDKKHLIYTIGDGSSPESCNPFMTCYVVQRYNGTTPGVRPGWHEMPLILILKTLNSFNKIWHLKYRVHHSYNKVISYVFPVIRLKHHVMCFDINKSIRSNSLYHINIKLKRSTLHYMTLLSYITRALTYHDCRTLTVNNYDWQCNWATYTYYVIIQWHFI